MINTVTLVGRIARDVEIFKTEDGKECSILTLAVPRSYKNVEGVYETDFIDCVLWKQIATNVKEFCRKGDIVGIKGRLETIMDEHVSLKLIAEKVSFLSATNHKEEGE